MCDTLLARAAGLTTGQLIEQIKKMAIAIDPEQTDHTQLQRWTRDVVPAVRVA